MTEQNEALSPADEIASEFVELTDSEKIEFVYQQALAVAALVEQAGPLLEQAGPMLAQAGPLLAGFAGPTSSPMGRILGSMLR